MSKNCIKKYIYKKDIDPNFSEEDSTEDEIGWVNIEIEQDADQLFQVFKKKYGNTKKFKCLLVNLDNLYIHN